MINLSSYFILPHPLAVEIVSQILVTVEFAHIFKHLATHHLIFLQIENILQTFSQISLKLVPVDV